ncbi:MAG: hypothetical protein ACOYOT_08005 [Bacteroidales bacterium]
MKRIFYLLFLAAWILQSCSKSDDSLNGNILIITTSTGETKTFKYANSMTAGTFKCSVDNYNGPYSKYSVIALRAFLDNDDHITGDIALFFYSPIKIGYVYESYGRYSDVRFEDWIESDNSTMNKRTIVFTDYNYPRHIAGSVTGYDVNGKMVAKGIFDFISTKTAQ